MAKQKQRWSIEEEEALSAGVERYGHGKWKHILSDPQFASTLVLRSNIDLKDKWRNMSVSGNGSSAKDRTRSLMKEGVSANRSLNSPEPLTAVVPFEFGATAEPSRGSQYTEASIDYKALILEALSSIEDPNGPDINAILNFIEDKYELPENFGTSVTTKLRRLVLTGVIRKVNKRYKLKRSSSGAGRQPKLVIPITAVPCNAAGTQPEDIIPNHFEKRKEEQKAPEKSVRAVPRETLEDAARVAAHAVAVAERVNDRTIRACEKVKTLSKILDEGSVMLALAKELHTICSKKKMVALKS